MKTIAGYNVYLAADGCDEEYFGFASTLEGAEELARSGNTLQACMYATAEAAGHCDGISAPDKTNEEDDPSCCEWITDTIIAVPVYKAGFTHEFHESGNGYPGVGEDVIVHYDDQGHYGLAKVAEVSGIYTRQWQANMIYLTLEDSDTDWDGLDAGKQDKLYDSLHHVSAISEQKE